MGELASIIGRGAQLGAPPAQQGDIMAMAPSHTHHSHTSRPHTSLMSGRAWGALFAALALLVAGATCLPVSVPVWAAEDPTGVTRSGDTSNFAADAPVATVTIDTARLSLDEGSDYVFEGHNPDFAVGTRADTGAPAVVYTKAITAPAGADGVARADGKAFTLRFPNAAIDQAGALHDVSVTYSNLTLRVQAGHTAAPGFAVTNGSWVFVTAADPNGGQAPTVALDADITFSVAGTSEGATTLFSTVDLDVPASKYISGGDYAETFAIVDGALSDIYIPRTNFNTITRIADGKGANGLKIAAAATDESTYNSGFVALMDAREFTLHWWGSGRGTATGFYSEGIKYWVRTTTTPGGSIEVTQADIDGVEHTYGAGQLDVPRTKSATYTMKPEGDGEFGALRIDGVAADISGLGAEVGSSLDLDAPNGGIVRLERGAGGMLTATVVDIAANHTIDIMWMLPVVRTANAASTGPRNVAQAGQPTFSMGSPTAITGKPNTLTYALIGPQGPVTQLDVTGGAYTINPTTGRVTFTPAENYHGTPTPATVEATDRNGKTARATYAPVVEPTPLTQTVEVTRNIILVLDEGHGNTSPALDANGEPRILEQTLTFTRQSSVDPTTGKDVWPAWKAQTMPFYAAPAISGWTAHVAGAPRETGITPENLPYDAILIYDPDPPVSQPVETYGAKNVKQHGMPNFILVSKTTADGSPNRFTHYTLLDANFEPAQAVDVPEGRYEIDSASGDITFTPKAGFVGTASPAYSLAIDANRRSVADYFTPHVIENTATGEASRSVRFLYSDGTIAADTVRQAVQLRRVATVNHTTGALTWGEWTKGVIDEVIAPAIDGWDADRASVPSAEVTAPGALSEETVTYSARAPRGADAVSYGGIGEVQHAAPAFSVQTATVPSGAANTVVSYQLEGAHDGALAVEGGRYTIDTARGEVTFTPTEGWYGEPSPVTVRATDANGLTATASYAPHVVNNVEAHEVQRSITYAFEDGTLVPGVGENPVVQKVTFRRVATVDAATGALTWPEWAPEHLDGFDVPAIEGWDATPSVVPPVKMDKPPADGLPGIDVSFVSRPPQVAEGAAKLESSGLAGARQSATVSFEVATATLPSGEANKIARYELVSPDGTLVQELAVEGGVYRIDTATGEVSFTPDDGFVGNPAPATVRGTDLNGKFLEVTYQPHIEAVNEGGEQGSGGSQGAGGSDAGNNAGGTSVNAGGASKAAGAHTLGSSRLSSTGAAAGAGLALAGLLCAGGIGLLFSRRRPVL